MQVAQVRVAGAMGLASVASQRCGEGAGALMVVTWSDVQILYRSSAVAAALIEYAFCGFGAACEHDWICVARTGTPTGLCLRLRSLRARTSTDGSLGSY